MWRCREKKFICKTPLTIFICQKLLGKTQTQLLSSLVSKAYQNNHFNTFLFVLDLTFFLFIFTIFMLQSLFTKNKLFWDRPLQLLYFLTFPLFSLVFVFYSAGHHLLERHLHPSPSLALLPSLLLPLSPSSPFSAIVGVAFIGGQLPNHPYL